ncbi:MAG TPA: XrtA system polysaccharide deacetylase [Gemmatimonadaceae bacterium]|nr:XrtA system polysaccharide deacetylase [Gemmatimonadaceae bacterium]
MPEQTTPQLFTVDVEEHFQVSSLEPFVPREMWDAQPTRVERNVDILLDLLARHGATATFFTLGWVADRHPHVVRRIAAAGHEIASHGWWHRRVHTQAPDEFRRDVREARALLQDLAGAPVLGYRAPSFSITPGHDWAFDVLLEEGYRYDSSLFPIRRSGYGWPEAPATPHVIRRASGTLFELPPATTVLAGVRVPAAGGGYLRQFPFALIRRAFREHAERELPGVFYIHPWEVDPGQPRIPVPWLTRVRHYRGLPDTAGRLDRLLSEFRFTSVSACFGAFDDGFLAGQWPALPSRGPAAASA